MQEVYKDGSGGEIVPFKELKKEVEKRLGNPNVDHVEIFNLGSDAHKKAVGRIQDLNTSRREKKRLKAVLKTKE